jgi:hypothetical protein
VIAVLQLTGTVINICYNYQIGARNASKDVERIIDQLKSMRDVLERLSTIINSENTGEVSRLSSTSKLLSGFNGPLSQCESELLTLQKKLALGSKWKVVGQALTWPLKEGDVKKTLAALERNKATLTLALTADQT